jgi:AraC-like DNA-binding protein
MEIQASPLRTVLTRDSAGNATDIRCSVIEMDGVATDYTVSEDRLSFWVPIQGGCNVRTDRARQSYAFSGNKVVVYPPGGLWRGSWQGRVTCTKLEIGPSILRELSQGEILFPARRYAAVVEDDKIRYSMLAMHQDLCAPTAGSDLFTQHLARGIALHYLERYCGRPAVAGSIRPEPKLSGDELLRVTAFIEERLQSRITLTEMAGLLDMNPTAFSRRFRQTTGVPPYRYVLQTRIELAKKALVQQRGVPLSELALSLGFYDQSQFCNTFRKLLGLSPSDYRRLHFS